MLTYSYANLAKNLHYYRCDLTNYDDIQAVAATLRRFANLSTFALYSIFMQDF